MWGLWCNYGFPPDQFWRQTPRTFFIIVGGAADRRQYEAEARLQLAWNFAVLNRIEKIPPLADLLKPRKTTAIEGNSEAPAIQPVDQAIAAAIMWAQASGGKIIPRKKKPKPSEMH